MRRTHSFSLVCGLWSVHVAASGPTVRRGQGQQGPRGASLRWRPGRKLSERRKFVSGVMLAAQMQGVAQAQAGRAAPASYAAPPTPGPGLPGSAHFCPGYASPPSLHPHSLWGLS